MQLQPALRALAQRLQAQSETPGLDAQVLAAQVLGVSRAWVLAHPEAELEPVQVAALEAGAQRLEQGEPLPYVLGHWEFYGLDFIVSPAVLIPRPETELLVEQALAYLRQRFPAGAEGPAPLAADVGTGSGCIGITLAHHIPHLRLLAGDISAAALKVARQNAARHEVTGRIDFVQSDLLPASSAQFDLICANVPYIPDHKLPLLKASIWEPRLALAGGPDGLDLVRRLLAQMRTALAPGGLALLEIEASQGEAAHQLAQAAFPHAAVAVLPDLAGRDRLVRVET